MTDEEITDIARDIEPDAWFRVHPDDEAWVIKFARAIEAIAQPEQEHALDAERYRFIRKNSYVELFCESPKVDGWVENYLDTAIAQAKESK